MFYGLNNFLIILFSLFILDKKTKMPARQFILNDFLSNLNYDVIYLLPFNNDSHMVSAHARNGARIQILTGRDLLKWNVILEAQRLQLHNRLVINLATNRIWRLRCTRFQRQQFTSLANDSNSINQNLRRVIDDTLNRIAQMNIPQVSNNSLENNFYNGTKFIEILPLSAE